MCRSPNKEPIRPLNGRFDPVTRRWRIRGSPLPKTILEKANEPRAKVPGAGDPLFEGAVYPALARGWLRSSLPVLGSSMSMFSKKGGMKMSIRRKVFSGVLFSAAMLLSGIVLAQGLPNAKPESVGMSSERLGRIKTALQREIDADRMPGAAVMIARKGKLVYSEAIGYQDKGSGTRLKKDAIFRIYSMTKPLASVAAMMLVKEGKIALADPVSKYLPPFAKMEVLEKDKEGKTSREPAKRPITILDLFRHTAGLGSLLSLETMGAKGLPGTAQARRVGP